MQEDDNIERPYEEWAQRKVPIWPLLKHRLESAILGAIAGLLLGLLTFGLAGLSDRSQELTWNWSWFGFVVVGATLSALIQNWRK